MVDYIQIVTVVSTIVIIIGGIYTLRQQIRHGREESERRIVEAIKVQIGPIQTDLKSKDASINDLWRDLEIAEAHLNKLQAEVARHSGVIDVQTPLIVEIRNQIEIIRTKIEALGVIKQQNG